MQIVHYLAVAVALLISYTVVYIIYNIYFHPLRKYPGPLLWSATRLPWYAENIRGGLIYKIHSLHQLYGPVVRIAPNELSYITASAWRSIYGLQNGTEMYKDLRGAGLPPPKNGVHGIISADRQNHQRIRKVLLYAFSEKSLREQRGFLEKHVQQLITKLFENASKGPLDLSKWYNWASFDILGDLAFGEPFGSLETEKTHFFVDYFFMNTPVLPWIQMLIHFGLFDYVGYVAPKAIINRRIEQMRFAKSTVERRLQKTEDRKDFLSYIVANNDEKGLSHEEIHSTAEVLLVAGSETTASGLSGATYHLIRNPRVYDKLAKEIRETFKDESSMDHSSLAQCKYLGAVLEEALRFYPPGPGTIPRVTPPQGATIDGQWVPGNTTVGVHQWATYRSDTNFHEPDEFLPERWLAASEPNSEFNKDNKDAFNPFSYGPRNCLGKNLAYAEMRLVFARLLWNFDLEFADQQSMNWMEREDHTASLSWARPPLMVNLKPVVRD